MSATSDPRLFRQSQYEREPEEVSTWTRQYIKETYGVDSELNEEGNYIKLYCTDGKLDVMNLVSAKNFINETFDSGFIDVIF